MFLLAFPTFKVKAEATVYWYNSCENVGQWSLGGGCSGAIDSTNYKENTGAISLITPSDGATSGTAVLIDNAMTSGWLGSWFYVSSIPSTWSGDIAEWANTTNGYYLDVFVGWNAGIPYFAFAWHTASGDGSTSPNSISIATGNWYWIEVEDVSAGIGVFINGTSYLGGGVQTVVLPNEFESGMYEGFGVVAWHIDYLRVGSAEEYPPLAPLYPQSLSIYAVDITSGSSISIPFTLNDTNYSTPFSATLTAANYKLSMTQEVPYNNTAKYVFLNYTDGVTDTDRTINLTTSTMIIANYQLVNYWFDYGGWINFGIGMSGLIMMFLSWIVAKWLWQDGQWFDAFAWWLIIFIIGAALVTVWVGF